MKNKVNNHDNRGGRVLERIENVFMTVSGIVIGLSPFLAFV
jgi:ABC-type Fe3+ transport system permease subunit